MVIENGRFALSPVPNGAEHAANLAGCFDYAHYPLEFKGGSELSALQEMQCTACRKGEPTVTDEEIAEYHPQVPDWELKEVDGVKRLERALKFKNFRQALAFTNKVGEAAEQEGHHPAILTEYGKVTVTWWTHKIGGLHRNDFIMAAHTDDMYNEDREG